MEMVERLGSRSRIAQTPPVKPSPSVTPDLSSTPTNFPMPPSSSSSPNDNGTATATGSPTEDGAYPLTTVKSRGATFTSKMTNFVNNGISITSALLYEKKNHHPRRVQVGMKLDLITELKAEELLRYPGMIHLLERILCKTCHISNLEDVCLMGITDKLFPKSIFREDGSILVEYAVEVIYVFIMEVNISSSSDEDAINRVKTQLIDDTKFVLALSKALHKAKLSHILGEESYFVASSIVITKAIVVGDSAQSQIGGKGNNRDPEENNRSRGCSVSLSDGGGYMDPGSDDGNSNINSNGYLHKSGAYMTNLRSVVIVPLCDDIPSECEEDHDLLQSQHYSNNNDDDDVAARTASNHREYLKLIHADEYIAVSGYDYGNGNASGHGSDSDGDDCNDYSAEISRALRESRELTKYAPATGLGLLGLAEAVTAAKRELNSVSVTSSLASAKASPAHALAGLERISARKNASLSSFRSKGSSKDSTNAKMKSKGRGNGKDSDYDSDSDSDRRSE